VKPLWQVSIKPYIDSKGSISGNLRESL